VEINQQQKKGSGDGASGGAKFKGLETKVERRDDLLKALEQASKKKQLTKEEKKRQILQRCGCL